MASALNLGWSGDGTLLLLLLASAAMYGLGVARLWSRAGIGRGLGFPRVALFTAGWIVLIIALVSPLHEVAERYFYVHMIEHELLMAVAAPLLVLSHPLAALAWALPSVPQRWPPLRRLCAAVWRVLTIPLVATVLHGIAIWAWHVPVLFQAALANEVVHWAQHASFFVTGLIFWSAIFASAPERSGGAVGHLFATASHMGLLGALLVFSARPWFATGSGALEDQQIGGLIMWAPGCMAYMIAALAIAGRWIMASGKRGVAYPNADFR
jgi:cytochrome c oxidase assembly factor CtaG